MKSLNSFETWGSYLPESIIPENKKLKPSVLFFYHENCQTYPKIEQYNEPSSIHHQDSIISKILQPLFLSPLLFVELFYSILQFLAFLNLFLAVFCYFWKFSTIMSSYLLPQSFLLWFEIPVNMWDLCPLVSILLPLCVLQWIYPFDLPSSLLILSLAVTYLMLSYWVLDSSFLFFSSRNFIKDFLFSDFLVKFFLIIYFLKHTLYIYFKVYENLSIWVPTGLCFIVSVFFLLVFRWLFSFCMPGYNFTDCRTLSKKIGGTILGSGWHLTSKGIHFCFWKSVGTDHLNPIRVQTGSVFVRAGLFLA